MRTLLVKDDYISELRRDPVSRDWVVIAVGRAKRPHFRKRKPSLKESMARCPFQKLPETLVLYSLNDREDPRTRKQKHPGPKEIWDSPWWVRVVKNLYPAFGRGKCTVEHTRGPYKWMEGVGHHEVVITKDHWRSFAEMSDEETELVVRAYQDRYLSFKEDVCVKYISLFHNKGWSAGASIFHPHSQIIAIPVIPPDINRSFKGAARYYKKTGHCVHCVVLDYELEVQERIVYENEHFLVFAPFASKTAFETRIFPKRHSPYFEEINPEERLAFANSLRVALAKLFKALSDPDYNFFIHTAPLVRDTKEFQHYHWHLEILPKTSFWAGFEISTGIEISTVSPEEAAKTLRKIKI